MQQLFDPESVEESALIFGFLEGKKTMCQCLLWKSESYKYHNWRKKRPMDIALPSFYFLLQTVEVQTMKSADRDLHCFHQCDESLLIHKKPSFFLWDKDKQCIPRSDENASDLGLHSLPSWCYYKNWIKYHPKGAFQDFWIWGSICWFYLIFLKYPMKMK